jgi:zinc transport system ATP-binding protein
MVPNYRGRIVLGITPNSSSPILAAHDVSFAYDGVAALRDVTFSLAPGEFAALVGPNGSGKSTLLRLLLGLLRPGRGRVEMFGGPPTALDDRSRLGYVPQRGHLTPELPATVREVVVGGRLSAGRWWRRTTTADRAAVDHALTAVALTDLAARPVTELSGGQQQRALIARALVSDPELLILDEPIAGVDAESQRLFRNSLVHLVAEHRTAVLLVSHELGAVADDLDRVIVLKQRVLFDGAPADLAARGVSLGIHSDDLPLWLEDLQ